MKKKYLRRFIYSACLLATATCSLFPAGASAPASIMITKLRCEHLDHPLGLGTAVPRFSWILESGVNGQVQTAYQVLVATSIRLLDEKRSDLWNSGKVHSDQSVLINYGGVSLSSGLQCWWKVRVWDRDGKASLWSEPATFETGLLEQSDWIAEWIRPDISFEEYSHPSPLLRKEFLLGKEVRSARLYISSLGLYLAEINGKPVGGQVFTPGWTSLNNRVQYQVYDVGDLLKRGMNAIGIVLGNGWYRSFAPNNRARANNENYLAARSQLLVTYTDGSTEMILTDKSWRSSTGPVLFSEIFDGEVYDARLEKTGWSSPGYDDSGWSPTVLHDAGKRILVAPSSPPVKRIEEITPVRLLFTPMGDTVFDMGQNMVGRVRLYLNCPRNTRIVLRHAEVLDRDGNFYTENLRAADQRVTYLCRGGGPESYEPLFTFQGFRYVAVSGLPGKPEKDMLKGVVIHSNLEPAGTFSCNDSLVNRLQKNIVWGQKGNFLDVPTDCPQRDERLGWTGDAQVFAPTACFNMNCAGFYTKWLRDLALDQGKDGLVPSVIPDVLGTGGAHGWADAAVIVPWTLYRYYGDVRILEEQYPSMKAWVEYMRTNATEAGLWLPKERQYGDWLAYATIQSDYPGATTDKDLLANAYFYHSTNLLQQCADILGMHTEAAEYRSLMEKIRSAFTREYITPNGRLSPNTQTAYTVTLSFGLIPAGLEKEAARRLAEDVRKFGHLTTGFLGTPDLCHVLTRYGFLDEAYTLLFRKNYPSWLYPVTRGATTIWERWDGLKPNGTFQNPGMNSFNHYAYGAVGDWLYRKVAGIDMEQGTAGFRSIVIKPHPGNGMNQVSATHQSPYGPVSSAWQIHDGRLTLEVEIPVNTKAVVYVPSTAGLTGGMAKGIPEATKVPAECGKYHYLRLELGSGKYALTSTFRPGYSQE